LVTAASCQSLPDFVVCKTEREGEERFWTAQKATHVAYIEDWRRSSDRRVSVD